MFFKVFLLMAIFTKISNAAVVADKDFYKHSEEYEDYEYSDDISEDVPSDSLSIEDSSESNSKEDEYRKLLLDNDYTSDKNFDVLKLDNNKSTTIVDNNDDVTSYIITDKPKDNRPLSRYEVTEIVDDIPNNVTFKPIVTNFTIKLPLNNASEVNNKNNANSNKGGVFNFIQTKDKTENLRKNAINIFHVTAEFDNDKDKTPIVQNIHINKPPFGIYKIKDRIDNFREHVLNSVDGGGIYSDPNDTYLPNILEGAKNLINKLREKGTEFFHKYFK